MAEASNTGPVKVVLVEESCFFCKQMSHPIWDCPDLINFGLIDDDDDNNDQGPSKACLFCDEMGHPVWKCPQGVYFGAVDDNNSIMARARIEDLLKFVLFVMKFVTPILECPDFANFRDLLMVDDDDDDDDLDQRPSNACFFCDEMSHPIWECPDFNNFRLDDDDDDDAGSAITMDQALSLLKLVSLVITLVIPFFEGIEAHEFVKFCVADDDDEDDDDDNGGCTELSSIVCVRREEDVKKVEEVEDCFILEFDQFSNLSLFDKSQVVPDEDDVCILAEKGQVACRDYPHPRHLCATYPFKKTFHRIHCKMCYCYICDIPAPCKKWKGTIFSKESCLNHCDATTDDPFWRCQRDLEKK